MSRRINPPGRGATAEMPTYTAAVTSDDVDTPLTVEYLDGNLRLSGEFDSSTAHLVVERLDPFPDCDLTVDLADVVFIDSSGLRTMINLQRQTVELGRQFTVVQPSKAVARLFDVAGVSDLFSTAGPTDGGSRS